MIQTSRLFLPLIVVGLAFVFAKLDWFSVPWISFTALILTIITSLFWRYIVVNQLSEDYNARFEAATFTVYMKAARWTALIFGLSYTVCIIGGVVYYFCDGSCRTFASILFIVGMITRAPLSLLATDWELHRFDKLT